MARLEALDGWRGICALAIVIHHFAWIDFSGDRWLFRINLIGHAYWAVDFFFVLSGFVLTRAYWGQLMRGDWLHLLWIRLGRLYPLHIAMLLAIFGVISIVGHIPENASFSPWGMTASSLLIHSLGLFPEGTWNLPSWSISAELWTDIIFAALSVVWNSVWLSITIITVTGIILALFSRAQLLAWADYGLARCLYEFAVGHLAFRYWSAYHQPTRSWLLELGIVSLMLFFVWRTSTGYSSFVGPFLFAACIVVFASSSGPVAWWLKSTPMQCLGRWSYSIYLTHWPVMLLVYTAVPVPLRWDQELAIGAMYLAIVIGVSAACYRWIEVPGQILFRYALNDRPTKIIPTTSG